MYTLLMGKMPLEGRKDNHESEAKWEKNIAGRENLLAFALTYKTALKGLKKELATILEMSFD